MVIEKTHESWKEFVNDMMGSMPLDGYFRGQWNPEWGLVPGAYRRFKNTANTAEGSNRDYAKSYLKLFKKYSSGVMADAHHLPENDDDKLVIWAQNYGLITKLLDWSFSPFVASFFAFADCAESYFNKMFESGAGNFDHRHVAVWYMPKRAVPSGVKIENTVPKMMHRQASQGSVFMIPTSDTDFDMSKMSHIRFSRQSSDHSEDITKHLIPCGECFAALECLRMMNIHYASLFPDLYGAAKQSNFESLYSAAAEMTRIVKKLSKD